MPIRGRCSLFRVSGPVFRILSHDLHHGGELAILLGLQGIEIPDLGEQGGHLTELPLADPSSLA